MLTEEVVVYCLTLLALRPHEVPDEVVVYLAEHHPFLRGSELLPEISLNLPQS